MFPNQTPILAAVNKAIATILLSIYMLAFSELPQLLKIPVFVQHYHEHQDRDPSTTLWGFVSEHYQGRFIVDDDYSRDMQLPFRTTNVVINTTVIFTPPLALEVPTTEHYYTREFLLSNDPDQSLISTHDIFQPPRV
ncbi:MAG: hypothetical protein EOO02_07445 [Chitinophagaceae bacterium]|nr:MAG: hypothetical protein EOO02_07445 [Chitinophagaceae bacterium]